MRFFRPRALVFSVALGILGLPQPGSTQTAIRAAADAPEKSETLPALDKRLMDTTADPCVDFAAYACGNFSKIHPIPQDQPVFDSFVLMIERTEPELRKLLESVAADDAKRSPDNQKIGDFYSTCMDDINFPAGILATPFYDPGATDAENYGHIGAIVGHELTHGFDDQGSKFDGDGNLSDWWTPEDEKKFNAMTDCVVQEYGTFTAIDDAKVNGKLTAGENAADNGGLRIAFLAFLADAKRKGIDTTAKQDGFTPVQQFFLAYGQNWCAEVRPEQVRTQVQTDPHSPDRFRIDGVVQNMQEFGQAFGCKSGQPMMPKNACHVW